MAAGDLPEDLVSDILSRLPLKSLLRLRCVHKSWNSLLKSSYFITTHLKNPNNKDGFILVKYHQDPDSQNLRFRLLNNCTFDVCLDLKTPFESDPWCFKVIGSCNGLVCLHDFDFLHGHRSIICNPFLEQYKIIPQSTFSESLDFLTTTLGFCYDSINNDYKVVRVGVVDYDNEKGQGYGDFAEVYTLGMNYWRKVEPLDFRFNNWEHRAFLNGAIHWSGFQKKKRSLVRFDASSEVFQLFPSPGCFAVEECRNVRIDVIRDSLCVVHSFDCKSYEIWVMKEYGVEESWTRLHAITFPSGFNEPKHFLGFGVNAELLLNHTKGLTVYYPDNEESKKVVDFSQSVPFIAALTYIESLVSLDEDGN